jgi:hypothetical protein
MRAGRTFAAGFVATLGLIGLAASAPSITIVSSVPTSYAAPAMSETAASVNRSAKGDRLVSQHNRAAPKATPVRTLREERPRRLEGCDPLVSPLARSSLSELTGRCIAAVDRRHRVAMAGG